MPQLSRRQGIVAVALFAASVIVLGVVLKIAAIAVFGVATLLVTAALADFLAGKSILAMFKSVRR